MRGQKYLQKLDVSDKSAVFELFISQDEKLSESMALNSTSSQLNKLSLLAIDPSTHCHGRLSSVCYGSWTSTSISDMQNLGSFPRLLIQNLHGTNVAQLQNITLYNSEFGQVIYCNRFPEHQTWKGLREGIIHCPHFKYKIKRHNIRIIN